MSDYDKRKKYFLETLELSMKVQNNKISIDEADQQFTALLHNAVSDHLITKDDQDAISLWLFRTNNKGKNNE